jgi:Ca2+-transporting ATPase
MMGRELDLMSDEAILTMNPFPNVFARVSPDNKLRIVSALQNRGEIVAMTGDGVTGKFITRVEVE